MCSARRLMVFNVCVKFHENMSSGFKVMERTRKLLTDTHTQRKDENIIPPWHTSYAGGIIIKVNVRGSELSQARKCHKLSVLTVQNLYGMSLSL